MNETNILNKTRRIAATLVGVLALTQIPAALAAGEWDVTLTPYIWAVGIDGDIDIGPVSANVNRDFSDLLDNIAGGGSLLLEMNNGRWVNWAELDYLALDNNDVKVGPLGADIKSDAFLMGIGTGYRFHTSERSTLDVLVGLRYLDIDNKIELDGGGKFSGDRSVTDGIVALRPRFSINEKWTFSPTLSVGAGDSDLVWELSPQFEYVYSEKLDVRFGYRSLNYKFKKGGDEVDVSLAGIILGLGFRF